MSEVPGRVPLPESALLPEGAGADGRARAARLHPPPPRSPCGPEASSSGRASQARRCGWWRTARSSSRCSATTGAGWCSTCSAPATGSGAPVTAGADGEERLAQATVRALRPGRLREILPGEAVPLLVRRAERTARLAADLAWFDVPTRLAARLQVLAGRFGHPVPGGVAIGLRLTHEDLADLCGTTRNR